MICTVCGTSQESFEKAELTSQELAKAWGLSKRQREAFDRRESSYCHNCKCSLRSRTIAEAIMKIYKESGVELFERFVTWAGKRGLKIAEINYCANLHPWLSRIPGTVLSQYSESTLRARLANLFKGIRKEDITKLSYPDESFDLVLHTEVLEHIDDYKAALAECRRILKPGGTCLFTIPIIPENKTKQRVGIDSRSKQLEYLEKPSYHGGKREDNLVFWEFGGDLIDKYDLKAVHSRPRDYLWVYQLSANN